MLICLASLIHTNGSFTSSDITKAQEEIDAMLARPVDQEAATNATESTVS